MTLLDKFISMLKEKLGVDFGAYSEKIKQTSGPWSINAKASRDLAKVPSGTIKFSNFYGKSSRFSLEFDCKFGIYKIKRSTFVYQYKGGCIRSGYHSIVSSGSVTTPILSELSSYITYGTQTIAKSSIRIEITDNSVLSIIGSVINLTIGNDVYSLTRSGSTGIFISNVVGYSILQKYLNTTQHCKIEQMPANK